MPTPALNARGGTAFVVQASLPESDVARLDEMAALTGKSRSAVARELIRQALGLDDAEGRAPPDSG